MTDAILERTMITPTSASELADGMDEAQNCLELHRVDWQHTMISADGHNLVCWFRGLDLESARIALRTARVDTRVLWSAALHEAPGVDESLLKSANVLVKRQFKEPVEIEDIQAIEDAGAGCLEIRNVKFVRTFFSADKKRMVCLYNAPDAESVRQAQREANMPFEEIWAFEVFSPETLPAET